MEGVTVKKENIKSEYKKEEVAEEETGTEDSSEVENVMLRNIELDDNTHQALIVNDFPVTDSDGNLKITTMTESGVRTFIIDQSEYQLQSVEGQEIVYEAADEDGNTIQYIIEEGDYDGEASQSGENSEELHYVYEELDDADDPDQVDQFVINEVSNQMKQEDDEKSVMEVEDDANNENMDKNAAETKATPVDKNETEVKEDAENAECDICKREFKTLAGLKRHITVNHGDPFVVDPDDPLSLQLCICCGEPQDSAHTIGDFKCIECDKLFLLEKYLARHTCLEHNKDNIFKCCECDKQFEEKAFLMDHMRVHPLKTVKCDGCGREFTRKYHLDRHIDHSGCMGTPRKAYECKVCERFFTRKDNLAEHLRMHAGQGKKKKSYICEYCNKQFQGYNLLTIHLRTHTGEKPYLCDLCPKKFPSSGAMKKHRRMHTGEKPYSCFECGKRFAAKETLNRHARIHTGEKPHSCHFCGKSFIQPSQLRAHIFHHTGENGYTCEYCGMAFNRRLRLTTHIKFMHEGADPLPCSVCGKTFFRKEDVQRHMLSHSGEKPFECDICQKRFSVKSSLKIHKLTHRTEPPCSCATCGRAFIRKDCLMRHMRARHRDVLEDILANAEKKRLQQQLLSAATDAAACQKLLSENVIWNELTLTESIKELLTLLVDDECLTEFGYPDAPVDRVLDCVIKRCGHQPASEEDFDYIGRIRENAKLLFTVVIDDDAVKELLNNQTVDEVILHVLRLAKQQNDK